MKTTLNEFIGILAGLLQLANQLDDSTPQLELVCRFKQLYIKGNIEA